MIDRCEIGRRIRLSDTAIVLSEGEVQKPNVNNFGAIKMEYMIMDHASFQEWMANIEQLSSMPFNTIIYLTLLVSTGRPKFSSWGKEVLCQVIDVDPITVFGNLNNS